MRKIKYVMVYMVVSLLFAGCGTDNSVTQKKGYTFFVTSEREDIPGEKFDVYDPFVNMGVMKPSETDKSDKQFQVGDTIYRGNYIGTTRFKYNNYWLDEYLLEGEAKGHAFFKEDTEQLEALWLSEKVIVKSQKALTSEMELQDLARQVIQLFWGKSFELDSYEVQINSHFDNLEDAYASGNKLNRFVTTQENEDIDYYEIIYQKKWGNFIQRMKFL